MKETKILRIALIVLCFGLTFKSFGQKVEISLKDKRIITTEVKAFSYDQLYFEDGSKVFYNEITVVNFITFNPSDSRLIEKLVENKITFTGNVPKDYKNYFETPHPGDKKIILVCSDSLVDLYRRIGRHLALKGYAIENSDKDFLTIKTALRPTSRWNFSYFLNVIIENNMVIITAEWKLNNSNLAGTRESGFTDWKYENDKRSGLSVTVNSIVYNDVMDALADFDKRKVRYQ